MVKLLNSIGEMKLGDYQNNTIDAFGDAYEYLMGMYASNAGKIGGEYFTPQEVSELLTRIALVDKTEVNKVYDPACGSGSLLLKSAKILGKDNAFRDGVLKTTGTGVDRIMPPVSRFGGGRAMKKQTVIEKLLVFFEKYFGLV